MKRAERRELEEKLTMLTMEDIRLSDEEINTMLTNAKATFDERTAAAPAKKKKTGKRIGRRIGLVFAAALSIIVCSFVYTAVMPQTVSNANNFFRTTALWVNNTFHLGFDFEPLLEEKQYSVDDMTFSSLKDAAAYSPIALIEMSDPRLTLNSVNFFSDHETLSEITIVYTLDSDYVCISISFTSSLNQGFFDEDSFDVISSCIGDIYCWYADSSARAFTTYGSTYVQVSSPISYDLFLDLCTTLQPAG